MQIDQVFAATLVVLLGALAVFATLSPPAGRRLRTRGSSRATIGADDAAGPDGMTTGTDAVGMAGLAGSTTGSDAVDKRASAPDDLDLAPAALDRVLRVGTWVFLFVVAAIVTMTGLWPDRQALLLALLAIAAVYVFIVHELLPAGHPDNLVLISEGVLGLLFAALLLAMTGGALSPFTPVFAMVVAGAAVVVSERAVVVVAATACAGYLAAVVIGGPAPLTGDAIAIIGVNLAIVALVAYVGVALGGEHRRARAEAVRRATEDELTGLRTRRSLFSALDRELGRSDRTGRAFCLLMIDLDDLKGINDRRGHMAGDAALRTVGAVIRSRIRRIDTGARFGGDEFVVLLPETDPTGGWVLAEQIRREIAEAGLVVDGSQIPTSASVGVVSYPHDGDTVGELLERADEAMYRAKRGGRDRVAGMPETPGSGAVPTFGPTPESTPAGVRDQPV